MTDPGFGSRARAIARLCVIFGVLVPFTVTLWVWQRIGLPGRESFKRWSYWRINSLIGMKIERRGRPWAVLALARRSPRFDKEAVREIGHVGGAVSNAGNLRTWCLRELRLPDDPAATQEMYDEIYPTFIEDKVIMEAQQERIDLDPARPLVEIHADSALALARISLNEMIEAEQAQVSQAAE